MLDEVQIAICLTTFRVEVRFGWCEIFNTQAIGIILITHPGDTYNDAFPGPPVIIKPTNSRLSVLN